MRTTIVFLFSVLFTFSLFGETNTDLKIQKKIIKIERALNKIETAQTKPFFKYKKQVNRNVRIIRKLLNDLEHLIRIKNKQKIIKQQSTVKHVVSAPVAAYTVMPGIISNTAFNNLIKALNNESFTDGKLNVLKLSLGNKFFTCKQVIKILNQFTFSSGKLKALRVIKRNIADRENGFIILNAFTFESDKKKATQILSSP